ncbi:MAG: TonB-dependent receptor plug domain-containing protein [Thermoanaerobaculia bacterium]|nr:TonB-dependent receptor plug domain-containing protein [Thermoanaerobaculia bacterium]
MIRRESSQIGLAAALLLLLLAPAAPAQDDAAAPAAQPAAESAAVDEGGATFDESVTVTAKKREESIYEVPVAITAFSGEEIARQGIVDLVDIGKFVPNLNVTSFSAGHTSSVNPFIRGIGLQDHLITTDPGVSVYVDGVYLGRQVGQNWNLSNIERVEVLRGPQGTLYGRNSIGGAINIITKAPGSEETSKVTLEAGSRGRWGANLYTNRKLSDDWAVAATGAYTRRDGLGKFVNLPNADVEVGELEEIAARFSAKWTPSERFSLQISADANQGDGGLRPYTTLIDEVPNGGVFGAGYRNSDTARDPYDNATGNIDQTRVTNEADGISIVADWVVSEHLDATLRINDRHSEYESGLDDDGFFDNFLAFPETGFADQTAVELQLTGDYGKFDFVAGLYYFEEEGENDQRPTVFLGGLGTFTLGQEVESQAIYANVGYDLSERTRVSGGLRFTQDDKRATININDGLIDTGADDDWSEVSGEVAVTHQLDSGMNVYGAIQSGYQSGQFPARPYCLFGSLDFSQPGNVSQPNCFVASDPITAVNYEVGIKGRLLDNLLMSVAVFFTQYSDLPYQVSTATDTGFNTQNLIVDQDSWGVEWEGSWYAGHGFYVHSSLGYINADISNSAAVAPLTPEITASISPELVRNFRGGEMRFRVDYSFRDDMYGEPSSDPGRFTQIASRDLINADITYHAPGDRWSLGVYGRNVTDERYDNARLNLTDYVLVILSNDASEFGVHYTTRF